MCDHNPLAARVVTMRRVTLFAPVPFRALGRVGENDAASVQLVSNFIGSLKISCSARVDALLDQGIDFGVQVTLLLYGVQYAEDSVQLIHEIDHMFSIPFDG